MKKGVLSISVATIIAFSMTTSVFANHIYVGPEVERVISYDENGNKVITLIFDPAKTPEFMKQSNKLSEEKVQEKTQEITALTEIPQVGSTLGHILKDEPNLNVRTADSYMPAYATSSIGQCVWYADGRFFEVHGIRMPIGMGNAKRWIENANKSDEIKTVLDINAVPEQSVAVYAPKNSNDSHPGHVVFIEYVERDENNNPVTIYYTEANSSGKGIFEPSVDGTVKKKSVGEFKEGNKLKLIGYIVPKEKATE